jgi:hypothetical protein
LDSLKTLLIFLPNKYFFLQTSFFSVKSTFKPLKRNPKHALKYKQCQLMNTTPKQNLKVKAIFFLLFLFYSTNSNTHSCTPASPYADFFFLLLFLSCNLRKHITLKAYGNPPYSNLMVIHGSNQAKSTNIMQETQIVILEGSGSGVQQQYAGLLSPVMPKCQVWLLICLLIDKKNMIITRLIKSGSLFYSCE